MRKATSKGTKRSVPARDVGGYLAVLPKEARVTLADLRKTIKRNSWFLPVSAAVLLAAAFGGMAKERRTFENGTRTRVLGLDRVIAFTYSPTENFDPKQLRSVTFIGPGTAEAWQYWRSRGVVMGVGHTWYDLLRSPVEKAVDNLVGQAYGGNPRPVVMIDEFGFDYGGQMDEKSARILHQTKRQKPELALAVWEMRGPIPQVLAETYRDVADLVMMESYVEDKQSYWRIASQVWSARRYGILPKTIVVLGVGKGGNPGENWAQTKEELEQQIRFVRLVAPESPGVGFYSGTPELLASADALSVHFSDLPIDGSGLPAEVVALARIFASQYRKPTLAVSPALVQPNYSEDGSGRMVEPKTMRAYLINLGDADARNVRVRLRNPPDKGGDVFAEGVVPLILKRSESIGVLALTAKWQVWGQWEMEVEAPGCEVFAFGVKR